MLLAGSRCATWCLSSPRSSVRRWVAFLPPLLPSPPHPASAALHRPQHHSPRSAQPSRLLAGSYALCVTEIRDPATRFALLLPLRAQRAGARSNTQTTDAVPFVPGVRLCACYAVSGANLAYGATRRTRTTPQTPGTHPWILQYPYTMTFRVQYLLRSVWYYTNWTAVCLRTGVLPLRKTARSVG
eukprot:1852139-Rhodomonas_salina.1